MNEQAIQEQYQHIVTLLKQQRLKEAQAQLEAFLWNSGDWTLRNRLEQAQTSYQYMLQYMRQGIDDPERQKLYRQILTETWEVADQAPGICSWGKRGSCGFGPRGKYLTP